MVNVELVKEIPNRGIIVKLTSPVINGAWQLGEGAASFHSSLQQEYPDLTFQYCYDREWHIHYKPSDDSMIQMAELISRIAQEETVFMLQKVQYISDHEIPNVAPKEA